MQDQFGTEVPEWANSHHIVNGATHLCCQCLIDDGERVELEPEDSQRLATWMGVNWEDGYKERVVCPSCGKTGQLTTKLMNERTGSTRTVSLGAAANSKTDSNSL